MVRILPLLVCPSCKGGLNESAENFFCSICAREYPVNSGRIFFIGAAEAEDSLDIIKNRLKNFFGQQYYRKLVSIIGPSYPFDYRGAISTHLDLSSKIVIDLGSGNNRIDMNVVTLDASDYQAVDIVADVNQLPFRTSSIDAFCTCSVLEHLPELDKSLEEISRCTKPLGIGLHQIPFMYPFHASPNDFTRLTHVGAKNLFHGWSMVEQRSVTGPVSLLLTCFVEFLSIVFSLGFPRLRAILFLFFCTLLFPIKYLDFFFVGRNSFISLAPTILTVLRKPGN